MHSVGYNIPVQPRQKKKLKISKALVFVFAISLFFLQNGPTISVVNATNVIISPPERLKDVSSYLLQKDSAPLPPVYSKSYLLMDASNGDVLVDKNKSQRVPVASTTKMVTALVAMNEFDLNEVVEVGKFAANVNGSEIKLMWGEKITVRDLIKGLLIQSGNDTAFALAEHYSKEPGNYQLFVEKMNQYVVDQGLTDTVFGDPAGLDDEIGRSTAWDLAHIARLLLADDLLAKIVKIPKTTIASVDGRFVHDLESSNRLILGDSSYYLPGSLGIKTGFTPDAGHSLVSAYSFGSSTLIGVVLSTNEYSITASANESRKLYSWANRYIEKATY